ncbi:TraI domain-containing protein [Paraburkholderia sediminicola]|uniref:TraI domain-containing protein n=1 Tax=Paraburkholderia sediminicola TaxID=458836 RepID=UPI0038BC1CFA
MTVLHSPIEAATLIADHRRRVDLIEQCANEAGKAEFQRKWLAILQRCAGWFSSMPLNPEIYREPGGAFRCTVETAFYAMRLAGGQKFGTNLPSEKRRRIEPQYNYAVFLAAVCSRLDEPYRHFTIERESDRSAWNPSVNGPAGPWLGSAPYRVARRSAPLPIERMRTGMLAQMLIGSELLTGLDAEVLSELFGAINPSTKPIEAESLLHKVIRQAVDTAVEFDRKAQRAVFEPVQFSVPSAIHVAAQLQPAAAAPPPAATVSAVAPASTASAPPAASSPGPSASFVASPAESGAGPADLQPRAPASVAASPAAPAAQMSLPLSQSEPRTLLEAIGCATDNSTVAGQHVAAVDPAAMRTSPVPADNSASTELPALFDEVLKGTPNMIRELFKALREDVAAGTAKVSWNDKGLAIPKRLIGSYGVASDTLVEHLRKRSLLVGNDQGEITLGPRAGQLIMDKPA